MMDFISFSAKQLLLLPQTLKTGLKSAVCPASRCSALQAGPCAIRGECCCPRCDAELLLPGLLVCLLCACLLVFKAFNPLCSLIEKRIFAVETEIQSTVKKPLDLVMVPFLCLLHQHGLGSSFQKAYAKSWSSMSPPKSAQKVHGRDVFSNVVVSIRP